MKVEGCWLKTAPPLGMAAGQIKQEVIVNADELLKKYMSLFVQSNNVHAGHSAKSFFYCTEPACCDHRCVLIEAHAAAREAVMRESGGDE